MGKCKWVQSRVHPYVRQYARRHKALDTTSALLLLQFYTENFDALSVFSSLYKDLRAV